MYPALFSEERELMIKMTFFKGSCFGNWRILLEDLGRGKGKRIRNKQGQMHGTPVTDGWAGADIYIDHRF